MRSSYEQSQISRRGGWYDAATHTLQNSEEFKRGDPDALAQLTELKALALMLRNPAKTAKNLEKSLKDKAGRYARLRALGLTYNTLGLNQEAVKTLERAREEGGDKPYTLIFLCRALRDSGRPKDAERVADEGLAAHPGDPDLLLERGNSRLLQDRRPDALTDYLEILSGPEPEKRHIVQTVIALANAKTYMEIGVQDGLTLDWICAPIKFGIDPVPPSGLVAAQEKAGRLRYFSMESDAFFTKYKDSLGPGTIDVSFVDGFHSYEQSRRDFVNSLVRLSQTGAIIVDDCDPVDASMGSPTPHAGAWTGDVWKTVLDIRSTRRDLRCATLDCEFGMGIITRGPAQPIAPPNKSLEELKFSDFAENRQDWLGLIKPKALFDHIGGK